MTTSKQQAIDEQEPPPLQLGTKIMDLSADQFRQCVFIIDELASSFDCHQFMTPVPSTAVIYHNQIKHPMDLKTLEENLFKNKYRNVKDFAKDLFLIWENAMRFHLSVDPIFQQALSLKKRYDEIILFIRGGKRPLYLSTEIKDMSVIGNTLIPEELYNTMEQAKATEKSTLYGIHIFSDQDHSTKRMYGGTNQHVFQLLNSYFFEYMSKDESTRRKMPLPRLYIAKNRTLLKQAHTDPNGVLAIIYDIRMTPIDLKGESLYKIRATVLLAEPVNQVHDVDDSTMDFSESISYSPKAWIKVRPLQAPVHHVESIINKDIDRNCLKKVFTTFRLSTKYNTDPKKIRNFQVAKYFAQSMLYPVSSSTDVSEPTSEIDAELIERFTSKITTTTTPPPYVSTPPSSSSSTTKSSAKSTAATSQVPKLRSRVLSNADLEPPTTIHQEQIAEAELSPKTKIKLTVSANKASASSSLKSSPESEASSSHATPAPTQTEKAPTGEANFTIKVNLRLPNQLNSKKHKLGNGIPASVCPTTSSTPTTKRLTINPPKDQSQIQQAKCTKPKASNLSSSPSSPILTAPKRPSSPLLEDNHAMKSKQKKSHSFKERKQSLSKEVQVKRDDSHHSASPPSATMITASAASSTTPSASTLQQRLPATVIYGYPPPHPAGYIYSHPPGIYQLAPNGYPQPHPYPEAVYYYPHQSNTPLPPLPQNGHFAYQSPSSAFIPHIPMQLPPLRLELPPVETSPLLGSPVSPGQERQQHQVEFNTSQARQSHYSLVNPIYTPTVIQPQGEANQVKKENEIDGNNVLNDAPTPDYEYSDPEEEEEEEGSRGSPSVQEDSDDDLMGSSISSIHSGDTDLDSLSLDQGVNNEQNLATTTAERGSGSDSIATTEPRDVIASKDHDHSPTKPFTRYADQFEQQPPSESHLETATNLWHKISSFAAQKQIPIVDVRQYDHDDLILIPPSPDHDELKNVFWIPNDSTKVIQLFKRMTIHQRVSEVIGLMQLAKLPHMPKVYQLLHDRKGEIIGMCMQRFEMTLREYTQHHAITAYQKFDIVVQVIESVLILHEIGITHGDLSSWNFMVNKTNQMLKDGSEKVEVWLTQFSRAMFMRASDFKEWWVKCPDNINADYSAQVVPKNEQDLAIWCRYLPLIQSKPVHRNYWYRSIEALPRHPSDNAMLSLNPFFEDLYTLGIILWEIISDGEPWKSLDKNDLNALRSVVRQDESLERVLRNEIPGSVSIDLLLKLLRANWSKRCNAKALLTWISAPNIKTALMNEWTAAHKRPLEELAVSGDNSSLYKKQKL
ncbi:hypothetical protein PS15m_009273 [Mucor circinelloides]